MKRSGSAGTLPAVAVFVLIVAMVVLLGGYLAFTQSGVTTGTESSSTTSSTIQGVVTGFVTVGPSQPVCSKNQSCNVDMSGYSLVFTPQCGQSVSTCAVEKAPLSPGGHYSILLPPGEYDVTGLYPSCGWLGCSSAFPRTVTVEGGMQLVFNVNIDTGIR